jgi:hypothetical protein
VAKAIKELFAPPPLTADQFKALGESRDVSNMPRLDTFSSPGRDVPAQMPAVRDQTAPFPRVPFGTPDFPLLELDSGRTRVPFGPPRQPYDDVGALGGLFAPAYIPGDPIAMAAVARWNAAHRRVPPGNPPLAISPEQDTQRDAIASALVNNRANPSIYPATLGTGSQGFDLGFGTPDAPTTPSTPSIAPIGPNAITEAEVNKAITDINDAKAQPFAAEPPAPPAPPAPPQSQMQNTPFADAKQTPTISITPTEKAPPPAPPPQKGEPPIMNMMEEAPPAKGTVTQAQLAAINAQAIAKGYMTPEGLPGKNVTQTIAITPQALAKADKAAIDEANQFAESLAQQQADSLAADVGTAPNTSLGWGQNANVDSLAAATGMTPAQVSAALAAPAPPSPPSAVSPVMGHPQGYTMDDLAEVAQGLFGTPPAHALPGITVDEPDTSNPPQTQMGDPLGLPQAPPTPTVQAQPFTAHPDVDVSQVQGPPAR